MSSDLIGVRFGSLRGQTRLRTGWLENGVSIGLSHSRGFSPKEQASYRPQINWHGFSF